MYYGRAESWNLRDRHMFATLRSLLAHRDNSKAVVWEHNSHIGNAGATSIGAHGETNVGELARKTFGNAAVLVGFGTDHGEVAAADDWNGPMHVKRVRPALPDSYEALCHAAEHDAFVLPLRADTEVQEALRQSLTPPRLERAIGVIYRPETERQSHWFYASLPAQFDEYIWIDRTSAVSPLSAEPEPGLPDTYPFGLCRRARHHKLSARRRGPRPGCGGESRRRRGPPGPARPGGGGG